jgi:hypothetical protein
VLTDAARSRISNVISKRMQVTASGSLSGDWSKAREESLKYYLREPFGNEEEGRSSVVSGDVAEVVDAAMPSLMRILYGGEDIVRVLPRGPEDVEAAKSCNDYVSLVLDGRNDGFTVLHDWIKDALITRVGACKYFWEDETPAPTLHEGLTPDEIELTGAEPVEGEDDLWLVPAQPKGRVRIESFPVEELYISATARDVSRAPIVAHGRSLTISDIRKMGYDVDASVSDSSDVDDELPETIVRDRGDTDADDEDPDPLAREVMFFEGFTHLALDEGEKTLSLCRVVFVGKDCSTLLHVEPADEPNIIVWSPVRMPHRLVGKSLADDVMDIQQIKSMALRGAVDGLALANNPRRYVVEGQAEVGDLIENRIGQIIRVKQQGAVARETDGEAMTAGLQITEYMDGVRQDRTGIRPVSSLNSDAINAYSQTARGAELADTAANDRLELIARTFAETAMKPLVRGIIRLGSQHEGDVITGEIGVAYKEIRKADLDADRDMRVSVGTGANGVREKIAKADGLYGVLSNVVQMQGGLNGPFVTQKEARAVLSEVITARGFKNVDTYLAPQAEAPPEPPAGPDPEQMAADAEMQAKQAKVEAELQLQRYKIDAEMQLAREKMNAELQLRREQLALSGTGNMGLGGAIRLGGQVG